MKNEIKNPMERFISKEETYFYGDGGVSDCNDCNETETENTYGNGGSGFYCAECGEYCPCGNKCIDKDGREVCMLCYRNTPVPPDPEPEPNPEPNPEPEPGHTGTFICSHCGGEFSVNEQNYVDPENTVCNACHAKINSYFVCSKCGYSCPCSFESAEEGVCKNCYVPPKPDPDNTESPKDDPTDTPSGTGGTSFVCKLCKSTCSCNNRSRYDDVCRFCASNAFCCAACGEVKYNRDMYGSSDVCKDCHGNMSLSVSGPDSIGTGGSGGSYFATISCSFDYVPDYEWSVQSDTGDFSITGAGVLTASAAGVATVTVRERKLGLIATKTVSAMLVNMCPYCSNSVTAVNRYLDTDVCNECATNVPIWYTPSINIIKGYEGTVRLNFSRNVYMPCSFESSDENVATAEIETIGSTLGIVKIHAKTPGIATITARIGLNGKTDTITVNVIDDMVVTPSATIIDVGETIKVTANVNDENYLNRVTCEAAEPSVLQLIASSEGEFEFKALKPGNTSVIVNAYNSNNVPLTESVDVTVRGIAYTETVQNSYTIKDGDLIDIAFDVYGYSKSDVVCVCDEDIFEVSRNASNDFNIKAKYRITNVNDSVIRFGIPDEANPNVLKYEKTVTVSVEADVYIICNSGNGLLLSYPAGKQSVENLSGMNYDSCLYVNYPIHDSGVRIWNIEKVSGKWYLKWGDLYVKTNSDCSLLELCDSVANSVSVELVSCGEDDKNIYKLKFGEYYMCLKPSTSVNYSCNPEKHASLTSSYVDYVILTQDSSNDSKYYPKWKIVSVNSGQVRFGFDTVDQAVSNNKMDIITPAHYDFCGVYISERERKENVVYSEFDPRLDRYSPQNINDLRDESLKIVSIYQRAPHEEYADVENDAGLMYEDYDGDGVLSKLVFFAVHDARDKGKQDAEKAIARAKRYYHQPFDTVIYFALEPKVYTGETIQSYCYEYMKGVYSVFKDQLPFESYKMGFYGIPDLWSGINQRCQAEETPWSIDYYMLPGSPGVNDYADYNSNGMHRIKQLVPIDLITESKSLGIDPWITYTTDVGSW